MCMCCVCHTCRFLRNTEEGVIYAGAGVTGNYEHPNMSAGNKNPVFCKNSKSSNPQSHFSSHYPTFTAAQTH